MTNYTVADHGVGNSVEVGGVTGGSLQIHVKGNNNRIVIGQITVRQSEVVNLHGDGNCLEVGSRCILEGRLRASGGSTISVGDGVTIERAYVAAQEGRTIRIGPHCLLASGIVIRTADAHTIYSLETRQRINAAQDVTISAHVWIATGATIQKGVVIEENCIVGAGAMVLGGVYSANCIIAGVPARIVKTGIIWDRYTAQSLDDPAGKFEPHFAGYLARSLQRPGQ